MESRPSNWEMAVDSSRGYRPLYKCLRTSRESSESTCDLNMPPPELGTVLSLQNAVLMQELIVDSPSIPGSPSPWASAEDRPPTLARTNSEDRSLAEKLGSRPLASAGLQQDPVDPLRVWIEPPTPGHDRTAGTLGLACTE